MKERVGEAGEVEVGTNKKEMVFSFRTISESFLQFTVYCLFLEKLVHPLEADSFSAMRCPMYQSSLVHKQAMDLFTHFSNPLTKTRMVAAKLLHDTPCLEEEPHSNPSMVYGALCGTDQQAGRGTTSLLPMDS